VPSGSGGALKLPHRAAKRIGLSKMRPGTTSLVLLCDRVTRGINATTALPAYVYRPIVWPVAPYLKLVTFDAILALRYLR